MKIVYYKSRAGAEPVKRYLNQLPEKHKAQILRALDSIELCGVDTMGVEFRQIRGKLWEIKIQTINTGYRIFYVCISNDKMVLLHAYKKQTKKAPKKELDTATKRMKEVLRCTLH